MKAPDASGECERIKRKTQKCTKNKLSQKPVAKEYALRTHDIGDSLSPSKKHNCKACNTCADGVTPISKDTKKKTTRSSREPSTDKNAASKVTDKTENPTRQKQTADESVTQALILQNKKPMKNLRKAKTHRTSFARRPWNQSEDKAISQLVTKYGTARWSLIAQMLEQDYGVQGRTGKQCRERYDPI